MFSSESRCSSTRQSRLGGQSSHWLGGSLALLMLRGGCCGHPMQTVGLHNHDKRDSSCCYILHKLWKNYQVVTTQFFSLWLLFTLNQLRNAGPHSPLGFHCSTYFPMNTYWRKIRQKVPRCSTATNHNLQEAGMKPKFRCAKYWVDYPTMKRSSESPINF